MTNYKVYDAAENIDAEELRSFLNIYGAVVVRGVLTPEEVVLTRRIVSGHLSKSGTRLMLGKTQPNAAIEVPALEVLFSNPKIVERCKKN